MLSPDAQSVSLADSFSFASMQYRAVALRLGLDIRDSETGLHTRLKELDECALETGIKGMNFYRELYASILEDHSQFDEVQCLWYAIRKLGLRPPHDLFERVGPNECFEIYDSNGVQVYRSFNFANYTSYSLEEILTIPWYRLFYRDSSIIEQMQALAGRVFSGEILTPQKIDIPDHYCHETYGTKNEKCVVSFKTISPLFDKTGRVDSFLATSEISRSRSLSNA